MAHYLPNPQAACGASTLTDYRSYNRFCFPDGIRFRPRAGSFEVYLVHPPSYHTVYSKLESGRPGFGICPISGVVDLVRHILSPEGSKMARTVFKCREDTGITGAAGATGGKKPKGKSKAGPKVMPEPEPERKPIAGEAARRPNSAPARPGATGHQNDPVVVPMVAPIAQPAAERQPPAAQRQPSSEEEIYSVDGDDFIAEEDDDDYGVDDFVDEVDSRPTSAVDSVMSEDVAFGGPMEDEVVADYTYDDDGFGSVVDDDEIVEDGYYGQGGNNGSDEMADEVVDDEDSLVDELPLSSGAGAAVAAAARPPSRPLSRISSGQETEEYGDDFDDEGYNSEEDSDYLPPPEADQPEAEVEAEVEVDKEEEEAEGEDVDEAAEEVVAAVATGGAGKAKGKAGKAGRKGKKAAAAAAAEAAPPKDKKGKKGGGRRVRSAPPGGRARRAPGRLRRPRGRRGAARELTDEEKADHARLMEAAGLLQGSHPTPLVLGAYGATGAAMRAPLASGDLGFRELRYSDARSLLETAEQSLAQAEQTRRAQAALQYVGVATVRR